MSGTPKYRMITDWVVQRIASGELIGGDRLESENEISRRFAISRQTVRHAISILIQEGMLESVQGSGTYVRKKGAARAQMLDLSSTVTIISTYVDGYIFPRILQSMVRALEKAGYAAKIMFTNNHIETERRLLEKMLEEDSRDAMIVEPVMSGLPNPNLELYHKLKAKGIPILFFHSYYPEIEIPHVSLNDVQVGRSAAEYLIAQGHTEIAGVFKADDGQGRLRYLGFIQAMQKAGLRIREERICWIDTLEMKETSEAGARILNRIKGCTACFCYNDELAHLVTEQCQKAEIRIPEELSLMGVDNSDLARFNTVPLTSVAHPMELLGKKTAENLVHMIQDADFDGTFEFETEIEERTSVCRRVCNEM